MLHTLLSTSLCLSCDRLDVEHVGGGSPTDLFVSPKETSSIAIYQLILIVLFTMTTWTKALPGLQCVLRLVV